jgi:hypothetical protein
MVETLRMMAHVRWTPWIGRIALLVAVLAFGRVGWLYILHPVEASARFAMTLSSVAAVTNIRVGFGAFHLGMAAIALACLTSTRRLIVGLAAVAIMTAIVVAVRLLGVALDGPDPRTLAVLHIESIVLIVFVIALVIEWLRTRAN